MERYKIVVNPEAVSDLSDIVDYLATLSEQAAVKYYDLIIEEIDSLSVMPERCPLEKGTQLRLRGYRKLLVKNYLVFYVVLGSTVEIHRIIYKKRHLSQLIK
jgi:addiction module RelE/StbE family toxin